MTIAEKLESIKASKVAIKQAIEAKGVACGDVLSEYPEKIASIQTGGDGIDMSTGIKFGNSAFTSEQFESLKTYNWGKLTDINRLFSACSNLTYIPLLDTSNVVNMQYTFSACSNLTYIPLLDTSKTRLLQGLFLSSSKITHLGGFKNLSGSGLDLSGAPLLTVESLMNVINNLKDLTGGMAQTLTLGATNLAKLTDEQKAVATNKNWVLA